MKRSAERDGMARKAEWADIKEKVYVISRKKGEFVNKETAEWRARRRRTGIGTETSVEFRRRNARHLKAKES